MKILINVEHPRRGRPEDEGLIRCLWASAEESGRVAYFLISPEMAEDFPYLEYAGKKALASPIEKELARDRLAIESKDYFANIHVDEFGKTVGIVIKKMELKGAFREPNNKTYPPGSFIINWKDGKIASIDFINTVTQ